MDPSPTRNFSRAPALRLGAMLLLALLPATTAALTTAQTARAAQVTYLDGGAQMKRGGDAQWRPLNLGDTLRQGDSVRTGIDARVEITLGAKQKLRGKRQLRIGAATEILLGKLQEGQGLRATVSLVFGRFWGSLRRPLKKTGQERFSVTTSTATIGVKGTRFGVDFDQNTKTAQVAVVAGQVTVAPTPSPTGPPREISAPREIAPPRQITRAQWTRLVSRDEKLILRPGEAPVLGPITPRDRQDPWVRFNLERDRL